MKILKEIYTSPFRVYLILGLIASLGIYCGFNLPVSLFPNSSKATISASMSYGSLTAQQFLQNYGKTIESKLQAIKTNELEVDAVEASYNSSGPNYKIKFKWGGKPLEAYREVDNVMNSLSAQWPKEIRDSLFLNYWSEGSGFIAVSFYSTKRSLDEVYELLNPLMSSKLTKIPDANGAMLWNPNQKEITFTLRPEVVTSLGIFPNHIADALSGALRSNNGGEISMGPNSVSIQMPRQVKSLDDLKKIIIKSPTGKNLTLDEVAQIEININEKQTNIFKTSGSKSLILFASPKQGGNVKRMAEDVMSVVREVETSFPKDIQYKVLVDPSEFIRSAVDNVFHEVFIAAALAVLVLFLFVGDLKNTATAAIEIPISMVMAFILMRMAGMNINLISLGGLALSAGMNVDASVVVMENILRYFEEKKDAFSLSWKEKVELVSKAVEEVFMPVVGSTIASLVVFIPLAFTSELTNAILGDLAKAVVFSHGLSAFVAIILVPTIRLQILSSRKAAIKEKHGPLEKPLRKLEDTYQRVLEYFLFSKKAVTIFFVSVILLLGAALFFILPTLPKEIIGKPDTDWIILGMNANDNTMIKQMEGQADKYEDELLKKFGDKIDYTFTQIMGPQSSMIMARLKNKKDMDDVWKKIEKHFVSTPFVNFWVEAWNPAEMSIPNPPEFQVDIQGGSLEDRATVTRSLLTKIQNVGGFTNVWDSPSAKLTDGLQLLPKTDLWSDRLNSQVNFSPADVSDLVRTMTVGKVIDSVTLGTTDYQINMNYPRNSLNTKEEIEGVGLAVNNKLVPLAALFDVSFIKEQPPIYRENGKELFVLKAKLQKDEKAKKTDYTNKTRVAVEEFISVDLPALKLDSKPIVNVADSLFELTHALDQLKTAILISFLLICVTLLIQFQSVAHTLIIITAIPLGLVGVIFSLFIFQSTLSLNSALGVILLNGIAVANSIILVDLTIRLTKSGIPPHLAAVMAAKKRLRPILMTSLTTILGMLPIALGMGEGGKILRPLGLAVAGGLWISMMLTLICVPILEAWYLERKFGKIFMPKQNNDFENKIKIDHNDDYVPELPL